MKKLLATLYFKLTGWKVTGTLPPHIKKCVIVVAPHTCNYDFPLGLATRAILNLKIRYLAKEELFRFPFGFLFTWMGGIPVKRNTNQNLVEYVIQLYNARQELLLALAPEGTRRFSEKWKKGFYFIALRANIPVALAYLNYGTKETGIGPIYYLTGNFEEDMQYIERFYQTTTPRFPERFNKKIY